MGTLVFLNFPKLVPLIFDPQRLREHLGMTFTHQLYQRFGWFVHKILFTRPYEECLTTCTTSSFIPHIWPSYKIRSSVGWLAYPYGVYALKLAMLAHAATFSKSEMDTLLYVLKSGSMMFASSASNSSLLFNDWCYPLLWLGIGDLSGDPSIVGSLN